MQNKFLFAFSENLKKVLPYIHELWGRTVHMESIVENKGVVFSYDGKMVHRKYV